MNDKCQDIIDQLCDGEDGWIIDAEETVLTVRVEDIFEGSKEVKVTLDAVAEFYYSQARNISSGGRQLAGHFGDWRPMTDLAEFCATFFKEANIDGLRAAFIARGLKPTF
jgi:hypothetical protein